VDLKEIVEVNTKCRDAGGICLPQCLLLGCFYDGDEVGWTICDALERIERLVNQRIEDRKVAEERRVEYEHGHSNDWHLP